MWKEISSRNVYQKIVVRVDFYRLVGAYRPELKTRKEEQVAFYIVLVDLGAGSISDEVIYLLGSFNERAGEGCCSGLVDECLIVEFNGTDCGCWNSCCRMNWRC